MEEKAPENTEESAQEAAEVKSGSPLAQVSPNTIIVVLAAVIVVLAVVAFSDDEEATISTAAATEMAEVMETPAPAVVETTPPPVMAAPSSPSTPDSSDGIERSNEGRLFYRTIKIPPGAETLYLSGTGANQKEDGTWGNMEEQAIGTFEKFKATLEEEGWSMSDIVQVRAFAVAGEYGLLDFDGFNRGYSRFFGTPENPNKPVRSFVQVADLVVDGWLVEVEIRAARMPE